MLHTNDAKHGVHSVVKPVCRLSESSSSWHMLRQKFAGSQVATRAALSVCLEISIDLSSRVAKTGGNYLQIKASIAQKLPSRNGWFLHIL